MGLASEHQFHRKGDKGAMIANLRDNGASDNEIAFMFADFDETRSTRRVELNAMTSPQFIAFVERKLKQVGVKKIVPEQKLLAEVYVGMRRGRRLQDAVDDLPDEIDADGLEAPKGLKRRVAAILKREPEKRWDGALAEIVDGLTSKTTRT
jgi:hypothetical protein